MFAVLNTGGKQYKVSQGDLINIEKLYLSGNQLTSIPESIGSLQNIQTLFISDNQLTSLPSTICDLPEDCFIQVKDNCIEKTYECIQNLGDQNECADLGMLDYQPKVYHLPPPYPNPFNPVTNIIYVLPEHINIQIIVYDLSGKQIEILINESQTPGYHSVNWDASSYSSGVYLIRMVSGQYINTRKVILLK